MVGLSTAMAQSGSTTVPYPSRTYTPADGLPERYVVDVTQDSSGFLWLLLPEAVLRFDGYRFEEVLTIPRKASWRKLRPGPTGLLWLTTPWAALRAGEVDYRVTVIDPVTQVATPFYDLPGTSVLPDSMQLQGASIADDHVALVYSTGEMYRYDPVSGGVSLMATLPDSSYTQAHVELIRPGEWLVRLRYDYTDRRLVQAYHAKASGEVTRLFESKVAFAHLHTYRDTARLLVEDSVGDTREYLLMSDGSMRSPDVSLAQQYGLAPIVLSGLYTTYEDDRAVYIPGLRRIQLHDKLSGKTYSYDPGEGVVPNFAEIHVDSKGDWWMGSAQGLTWWSQARRNFKVDLQQVREVGASSLRSLTAYSGSVYAMIEMPLGVYAIAYDTVSQQLTVPRQIIYSNDDPGYALAKNRNGIYFGHDQGDSIRVIRHDGSTTELFGTYESSDRDPWSMYAEADDRLWIGHSDGSYALLDPPSVMRGRLPSERTVDFNIYQFYPADAQSMWAITTEGLYTLDRRTGAILDHYHARGKDRYRLPVSDLRHLHRDRTDGSYWLATGEGLVHWYPDRDSTYHYTFADGLSNEHVHAVYEDDYGHLWLPSDNGLMKLRKATRRIVTYTEREGVAYNEFNRLSHYQHPDGTLLMGGVRGLTYFHPRDFADDTTSTDIPLELTEVLRYDEEAAAFLSHTREVVSTGTLRLPPSAPSARVEFVLLDFDDAADKQYAYQIEGLDDGWLYQRENSVRLNNLPYGSYTLRVRAQTADGVWSDRMLALRIEVPRPWYAQPWLYGLLVLLIAGAGYAFYLRRTYQLRKRQRELESLVAARTQDLRQERDKISVQADQLQRQSDTLQVQAEELKAQAEAIRSLEQLKSRFFTNISHELRTPLTLILGPLATLLRNPGERSHDERLLRFAQRNAQSLLRLVNEILDLSKLESGKLPIAERPVVLHRHLQQLLSQFHSFALSNQVRLSVQLDIPEAMAILLDVSKFDKILTNLLSNALKYTPEGRTVSVAVEELDSGELQLAVADQGPGIHPNDLPHIFDRFYQSEHTEHTVGGGSGIGLALSSELSAMMGGELWVESPPGEGATFFYRFPKRVVAEPTPSTGDAALDIAVQPDTPVLPKPTDARPRTARLLIVEDSIELRHYLELVLSDYPVMAVEHGEQALAALDRAHTAGEPYDLILSDLMMPVMDGMTLLERVKRDERFWHLPFIMLTARAGIDTRLSALRLGIDDYLTKPFVDAELLLRIDALLENVRRRATPLSIADTTNSSTPEATQAEPVPTTSREDLRWLRELEQAVYDHIEDSRLSVAWLAELMQVSRRNFQRQVKVMTGLSPREYLKEARLQYARRQLEGGTDLTITELARRVGYSTPHYFRQVYEQHFGILPEEVGGKKEAG